MESKLDYGLLCEVAARSYLRHNGKCYTSGSRLRLSRVKALKLAGAVVGGDVGRPVVRIIEPFELKPEDGTPAQRPGVEPSPSGGTVIPPEAI